MGGGFIELNNELAGQAGSFSEADRILSGADIPVRSRLVTILNQRWALLVLKSLIDGPKRFNELSKITDINPNTLRERLREFESAGVVKRTVTSETPPNVEYCLTEGTEELASILEQLFSWARRVKGNAVVQMAQNTTSVACD